MNGRDSQIRTWYLCIYMMDESGSAVYDLSDIDYKHQGSHTDKHTHTHMSTQIIPNYNDVTWPHPKKIQQVV